ncbi:Voltage-dependent calcium channel subunit alpha-2/delta-3 [Fukomys damarensis]|uniref:Voltage-dependent calcium channel subunit alpha-2/delta-3 n=1 Tax=Fukomys damarensis TaxID=885580 RepID=A0A091D2G7_FUKDA|nr:Voltage-dependent calcium channel subunit alpha-2/delta-3 [Fukomys damarensis]
MGWERDSSKPRAARGLPHPEKAPMTPQSFTLTVNSGINPNPGQGNFPGHAEGAGAQPHSRPRKPKGAEAQGRVKLWASAFGGEIKSIAAKYSGSQLLQKVGFEDMFSFDSKDQPCVGSP